MKRFALTGAAGYVAPRHIEAIHNIGGDLIAILDPSDSVGVVEKYFPNCKYFSDFERLWRELDKLQIEGNGIDYLSVCSPNYLHDAHCMLGLSVGANVICEKPLVLYPENAERLKIHEKRYDKKIYNILQLRYHPEIIKLKENIDDTYHNVNLQYITRRGKWYKRSWKGDESKSGGILFNIGIHLFDMLIFLFGKPQGFDISNNYKDYINGFIYFENVRTEFTLSIDFRYLPKGYNSFYRSITMDGKEVMEFDVQGLHELVYKNIVNDGITYSIDDVMPALNLVYDIRRKVYGK